MKKRDLNLSISGITKTIDKTLDKVVDKIEEKVENIIDKQKETKSEEKNPKTAQKIVDEEVTFEDAGVMGRPIISKTDLEGNITYANKAFCKLAGYSKEELIGKPHNIIRHPDMPKEVFKQLWDTIEKNGKFRGFIKNLRKDGKYYWTEAFVEPIFDENGVKTGYISARRPIPEEVKKELEAKLKNGEFLSTLN